MAWAIRWLAARESSDPTPLCITAILSGWSPLSAYARKRTWLSTRDHPCWRAAYQHGIKFCGVQGQARTRRAEFADDHAYSPPFCLTTVTLPIFSQSFAANSAGTENPLPGHQSPVLSSW